MEVKEEGGKQKEMPKIGVELERIWVNQFFNFTREKSLL